jgi:16S rRNA (cytidine1402-2'-O)-methyltransferase
MSRTLKLLDAVLPERTIAVCRELTKLHEEIFVGVAAEALQHFSEFRGEFVLVIEGVEKRAKDETRDEEAAREEMARMRALGLTRSQASALLERLYGVSRRRLYELWLQA